MPSLITSYFAQSSTSGDQSTLASSSFTPSNGEVIVVKGATWDTGTPIGPPSGGGLTYTQRAVGQPGGFAGFATIYTAVVSGSPGSMTVSVPVSAPNSYHSIVVERWSSAQLAATPATNSVVFGNNTSPSTTLTSVGTNSIVTWVNVDEGSADPTGRVYSPSATEDGLADGHTGSASVHYYAYQTAASPGTQTFGMSVPASQKWTMVGIEVLDATVASSPAGAFMSFFE